VKEARVAFECTLDRIVTVGQGAHAGNLVLGTILLVHVQDELLEAGKDVDPIRFDAIGRLSGTRFCRTQSVSSDERAISITHRNDQAQGVLPELRRKALDSKMKEKLRTFFRENTRGPSETPCGSSSSISRKRSGRS
jgi:hypothetical protein